MERSTRDAFWTFPTDRLTASLCLSLCLSLRLSVYLSVRLAVCLRRGWATSLLPSAQEAQSSTASTRRRSSLFCSRIRGPVCGCRRYRRHRCPTCRLVEARADLTPVCPNHQLPSTQANVTSRGRLEILPANSFPLGNRRGTPKDVDEWIEGIQRRGGDGHGRGSGGGPTRRHVHLETADF